MTDSFQETRKISYGENIKNSFAGALGGLVLFLASFGLLWWNEGNNVAQIHKANYMGKAAIEVDANKIDRKNDNQLVQLSGVATTNETLSDDIIKVPNAFKLTRKVEMYQWEEKKKTEKKDELGGGTTEVTTYSYDKVWASHAINSDSFKRTSYRNPEFKMEGATLYAQTGKLGEFKLTEKQSKSMGGTVDYTDLPSNSAYKIVDNKYYKGYNPENPQIGDIRISYTYIPSGAEVSIIAQQKSDNTLDAMPYKKSSVYVQQGGIKDKAAMIDTFRQNNKMVTIFLRILGWFLMFSGLNMMIDPLIVIFKVVPFVANVLRFFSKGVVALVTLALSLLTIAIAWLAYRPFLSIFLIALIGGIGYGVKVMLDKRKTTEAPAAAQVAEQPANGENNSDNQ